jgi:hypothetical protein
VPEHEPHAPFWQHVPGVQFAVTAQAFAGGDPGGGGAGGARHGAQAPLSQHNPGAHPPASGAAPASAVAALQVPEYERCAH